MTDNRDLIARRIRALQTKTVENGCTEEEALIAAQKAGELMAQYRLTQSDIEIQTEPVEHREVDRRQREKQVSEDSCLRGIQRYCSVKAWLSLGWDEKGEKHRRLVLFGLRAASDLAEWLYKMIGSTIMAEAERFKARTGGGHTVAARRQMALAFRRGMAARINERLVAMAAIGLLAQERS
jgi:hypothetical protein